MKQEDFDVVITEEIIHDWQEIVDLLAELCDIPAALIMRHQEPDIEVLVSSHSDGNPYQPGDKEHFADSGLYCETVIKSREKLLVADALSDPVWQNNPDIQLNMISYLGFPLLLPNRKPFGTLCILDEKTNAYNETIERLMLKFKQLLETQLEYIYVNQVLGEKNKRLTDYLPELQALRGTISICSHCKDLKDEKGNWYRIEKLLVNHPDAQFSHSICPRCFEKFYPDCQ